MSDLKNCRVLVTSTSYGMNDSSLRSELEETVGEVIYNPAGHPLASSELVEMIGGIDGWIAGLDFIDRDVIAAANKLKIIARYGVGLDRVDLDAAKEKGIIVTNTPAANATSVAELTIGLMITLARRIPFAITQTRLGEWPRIKGVSLSGKTIGLLGLGAIGRRVANMLDGFQCRVIGFDPALTPDEAAQWDVELLARDEVIQQADFLSLHLPSVPETENMMNADVFSMMKEGAYLINTARIELIDEDALLEALQSGKLAGAALDTFRQEPPDPNHPLLKLEQVVVTPHTGAHTDSSTNMMGRMALNSCLSALRNQEPPHRIV